MPSADDKLLEFFTSRRDRGLLSGLDPARVPAHVAIIMDGNGRWAKRRGLPRIAGHRAGAKALRECIITALELRIRYLTVYSFSSENWRRPADEVTGLMSLFAEVLDREVDSLDEKGVRLRVIGRRVGLPEATEASFANAETRTARNDKLTMLVALDYGGREEIVAAARSLAADAASGALDPAAIDEAGFAARLSTADVPDPDLLVRTSGEERVSNFLLWQIAYSELWFTTSLWPDFRRGDLLRAIVEYQRRERRFGS
jgi:undecaprenyl diphosphate synthase